MQRTLKQSVKLLGALISSLASFSCATGKPNVTVCIVDNLSEGFQCANDEREYYVPYDEAENFVCMSGDDYRDWLLWTRMGCRK